MAQATRGLILLTAVLAFGLFSSTAYAQDDAERAQAHFEEGAMFYTQGDYSKAIVEFLKGHAIEPNAMFLYNISLSYWKLGNVEDALAAAERSRNERGMPDRVKVRNDSRIAAFSAILGARRTSESIEKSASTEASVVARTDLRTKDEIPPDDGGVGAVGWTGVGLGVVGAGLVVGALVVNSGVSSDIETLQAEAAGGDQAEYDRLRSSIESGQTTGQILLYSGLGVATTGLVMLIADLATGSSGSSEVSLMPTSDGFVAGFNTRF